MATETFVIDIQTKGTKRSERDIKRIGNSASSVRKTLAFMRSALVAVASIRVFASLTQDIVAFSDEMLVVKAVTDATATQFARLKETAQGLGATTRFTAAEAASGMAFLARAGFEVNEVMTAIPGTLDLAAAAQLELGNAADIASNLMTSFGLSVAELPDVIDTLVFTANNANTNVQQLADGLKLFAPLASQFGISIEQASSAMGVLGDSGIQASLAGTGLRRIITDLEAPTGALAKVLKLAGVSVDDIRPSMNDLSDIIDTLTEANIGASAASLAFGKRGGFVFAALQRQRQAFRDLTAAQEKNTGVAKRNAEIMEMGLGGALRLVRSAAQNVLITFANLGAEESLNQFFRGMATALRAVASNAEQVVTAMKILLAGFAIKPLLAFSAALLKVSGATKLYNIFISFTPVKNLKAALSFKSLGAAMKAVPWLFIIGTLVTLSAGLAAFGAEIELVGRDGEKMQDTFTVVGDFFENVLLDIVNSMGGEFGSFGEVATKVAQDVAAGFRIMIQIFAGVGAVIKLILGRLKIGFQKFVLDIFDGFLSLQEGIQSVGNVVGLEIFDPKRLEAERGGLELLTAETLELEAALFKLTVRGEFLRAGAATGEAITTAAQSRISDARIIASENARRKAAQDRAAAAPKEVPPAFIGDQFDISGDAASAAKEIESLVDSLRQLEAAHFPLLAVREATRDVLETINDAEAKGIKLRVNKEELIRRSIRSQLGANITLKQAGEEQEVLNNALRKGIILQEEFDFLSRKSGIAFLEGQRDAASGASRAFLKLQQEATDAAKFSEMVFTDAFKAMEDQVISFVDNGKISFDSFFQSLRDQLLRLGTQQAIAGLGSLFQGPAAGGTGASGGGGNAAGIGGLVSAGIMGLFHEGGGFTVGASNASANLPGVDNRLVAFGAQDGEQVTVTPKNAPAGAGPLAPLTIVQNITTKDADSFNRSESQIASRAAATLSRARRRA